MILMLVHCRKVDLLEANGNAFLIVQTEADISVSRKENT